jgi:hypothetical protein
MAASIECLQAALWYSMTKHEAPYSQQAADGCLQREQTAPRRREGGPRGELGSEVVTEPSEGAACRAAGQ